jgi:hypothetical protein
LGAKRARLAFGWSGEMRRVRWSPDRHGRLGCANHHARNICSNNRTILRHRLQAKIFAGLKRRLLAPELVAQFANTYVQEVHAANQERGARRAKLQAEQVAAGAWLRISARWNAGRMTSRPTSPVTRSLNR